MAAKSSYHHGDLAGELMQHAVRHIAAEGTESLSLRALARAAGVSQSAPYRHFPSKRCLLAALATEGFGRLERQIGTALAGHDDLEARFLAMGTAYVQFAVANPTHYHLMFGAVLGDFSDYDMLVEAATRCFARVTALQEEIVATHRLEADPDQLAGVIWAGVHGTASLLLNMTRPAVAGAREPVPPMLAVQALGEDVDGSLRLMYRSLIGG
ncbi:MAG: TetR/AcrR family transcriptional regulator [Pseudomonadota bacterium]